MNSIDNIYDIFTQVNHGLMTPDQALKLITPNSLAQFLSSSFLIEDSERTPLHQGEGILGGDVSGVLVLSRDIAHLIVDLNRKGFGINYIYCLEEGDIDDFHSIKHSSGFFTSNPGKTTFSPVQSVQEGVPTIIAVAYVTGEDRVETDLVLEGKDGTTFTLNRPKKYIEFAMPSGGSVRLNEGDYISLSGSSGNVWAGKKEKSSPQLPKLYVALTACYHAAREQFGPAMAWQKICDTLVYAEHKDLVQAIVNSDAYHGFEMVRDAAQFSANCSTFVNVHSDDCVVWARLIASKLRYESGHLSIVTDEQRYGVGLLRDERMWIEPDEIDLLRVLLLGENATSTERFEEVKQAYIEHHSNSLFNVLSVGTGSVCVARTLCMPFSKFLPDNFDTENFANRMKLNPECVKKALRAISGEREVYHGCRGVRLFNIREDIAEAWLTALLMAAKRTTDLGIHLNLRILLATLTFSIEAERFMQLLDPLAPKILGDKAKSIISGVASMMETTGAYIDLEEIFSVTGKISSLNGGLIGTNDFTTACLNLNRGDAPKTIIPGYVKKGLFEASPFKRIHPTVGKAIRSVLDRTNVLGQQIQRDYQWGLAGELSYDWDSVQWLAEYAAPKGLNYISTSPDTIIPTLFAIGSVTA